jgi:hypothetical protein
MTHHIIPPVTKAPTKIVNLQATRVAGLVEHPGTRVHGQVPQLSGVPVYHAPMPKLPKDLIRVHPSATRPCYGHIKMEEHSREHGLSLVYIG